MERGLLRLSDQLMCRAWTGVGAGGGTGAEAGTGTGVGSGAGAGAGAGRRLFLAGLFSLRRPPRLEVWVQRPCCPLAIERGWVIKGYYFKEL